MLGELPSFCCRQFRFLPQIATDQPRCMQAEADVNAPRFDGKTVVMLSVLPIWIESTTCSSYGSNVTTA